MAKGHDRVAAATAERQERQKQFEESRVPQLWLKEGQAAVLRFLEQGPDVNNFARHPYLIKTKKGPQTRFFTCLNDKGDGTACPGCSSGLDEKIRGVYNVIQRNRPVLRTGGDGRAVRDNAGNFIVDGHEDAVVVWDIGSLTAESIRQMDADYNGLMSRDFKVSRTSGSSFQPYVFSPADPDAGAVPMSQADQALMEKRHNLDEMMAPPSYADAAKLVAASQAIGGQGTAPAQAQPGGQGGDQSKQVPNPFLGAQQ